MENPIKIDDLGVPLFLETPTWHLSKRPFFLKNVCFFLQGFHPDGPVAGKKCGAYFLDFKGQNIFCQKDIPMSHCMAAAKPAPICALCCCQGAKHANEEAKNKQEAPNCWRCQLCGDRIPSFPCIFPKDFFFRCVGTECFGSLADWHGTWICMSCV